MGARKRETETAYVGAAARAAGIVSRLLGVALGDESRAAILIEEGLARAGLRRIPDVPRDALEFVKAHVIAALSIDVGPRIALAVLEDLAVEIGVEVDEEPTPESSHPRVIAARKPEPPRPESATTAAARTRASVLVVDPRRLDRASLARALVRGGCDVAFSETAMELRAALASGDSYHAAVVDMEQTDIHAILALLASATPPLPIVARATSVDAATALLVAVEASRFDVRLKTAPADEILDIIRQFAPASRVSPSDSP